MEEVRIEDYVNNQHYLTNLTSIIQVGILSVYRRRHRIKISCPLIRASHKTVRASPGSVKIPRDYGCTGVEGWVISE